MPKIGLSHQRRYYYFYFTVNPKSILVRILQSRPDLQLDKSVTALELFVSQCGVYSKVSWM